MCLIFPLFTSYQNNELIIDLKITNEGIFFPLIYVELMDSGIFEVFQSHSVTTFAGRVCLLWPVEVLQADPGPHGGPWVALRVEGMCGHHTHV